MKVNHINNANACVRIVESLKSVDVVGVCEAHRLTSCLVSRSNASCCPHVCSVCCPTTLPRLPPLAALSEVARVLHVVVVAVLVCDDVVVVVAARCCRCRRCRL